MKGYREIKLYNSNGQVPFTQTRIFEPITRETSFIVRFADRLFRFSSQTTQGFEEAIACYIECEPLVGEVFIYAEGAPDARRVDADIKELEGRLANGCPSLAPWSRHIQNVIDEVRSLEAQLVRERNTFELANKAVLDAIGPYQDEQACDKPNAVEGVQALHDHIKKLDEALATCGRERKEALGQLGKERNAGYVDGRRSAFQEIRDAIDRGEAGF